jgi:Tfp pilus assembly protein PilF
VNKIVSTLIVIIMFGLISGCNQDQSSEEYIKSGQEYLGKKEWKSAIIEFKNAIKQAPDNATARAMLGKTYLETQSSSAAIKELNRAIDLGFERSELLLPLGRAYRQAGENQKIIDEIKPDDNQSTVEKATIDAWRGISYLSLGNKEAARESLDQARNLDGEATEVRLAWATYERTNGNTEAQERWLQPLLERDGGIADAWSQMGEI